MKNIFYLLLYYYFTDFSIAYFMKKFDEKYKIKVKTGMY